MTTAPPRARTPRARPVPPSPAPPWLRGALLAAVPVALLVALVAVSATGAAAAPALGDPGATVRYGLPGARVVADLAAALALGALLLLAVAVRPGTAAWARGVRTATAAVVVWVPAAALVLVLSAADVAALPPSDPAFGAGLAVFVGQVELGQDLAIALALAVVASMVPAVGVPSPSWAATGAVLVVVALVPLALSGHSAGASDHRTSVSSWWLHGVGVGAWVGGLAALALMAGVLGRDLPRVAARYSALAGWAYALVVLSGLANAQVRLAGPADLATAYGALVVVKAAAAVALGAAGWAHRRRTLARLGHGGAAFWRLVAGEVVLMAATVGVAVALSRTAPPVPETAAPLPTPAELLTGEALPPLPLTAVRAVAETRLDLLWLLAAALMVLAYVGAVRRLRRRGDRWPVGRTVGWLLGCAVLAYVTSVGPAAYSEVLFSAHMVTHMAMTMVVPPLLVVGAPVTLALRALPRRDDGTRGPREWLLVGAHSRVATLLAHPVVAAVLFAGSLVAFYYTPLFGLALRSHVGHELMQAHFLLTGYLFASALIGVDPGPPRPAYPLRLVLLLATMAFHAFFGVALLSGDRLLEATWFSSLGTGVDALADQRAGGGIAWGIGELPTLVVAVVLAVQWARSDDREARRGDRAADRDDDAALRAHNAMLERLGSGDRRGGGQGA